MKPVGPLMREHRLIEQMLEVVRRQVAAIKEGKAVDPCLVLKVVDFFRTYADRTHHGKEEDILFRKLEAKEMAEEHLVIMVELKNEHRQARSIVGRLNEAAGRYTKSDSAGRRIISGCLKEILALYPSHIEKEDKRFFYPILDYFTADELDKMLDEFWEFDRIMIHEKYQKLVEETG